MSPEQLRQVLERIRNGSLDIDSAMTTLRTLPFEDLGFARLDHHRTLRTGYPEVVFCQGKTTSQIVTILERLSAGGQKVLATRATPDQFATVQGAIPKAIYHADARIIVIPPREDPDLPELLRGRFVGVVTAGTADLPVAEEAAVTAEELGSQVRRFYDIGVAGLHRLLHCHSLLCESTALVVCAGMEGALASVVGGLVPCPVVAVPTSVGYGASAGGFAALLSMLSTCATGVAVMNIDNGFGGGYYAHLINSVGIDYLARQPSAVEPEVGEPPIARPAAASR